MAKSVDDDDPLPPYKLPRGYGGVATLWHKDVAEYCAPQADGSHRINVLRIGKATVINAYLPCRGSHSIQEFQEEIDQLHEILCKYKNTHTILAGDLNVDQHATGTRGNYFRELIGNHTLTEVCDIVGPTFIHHNGVSTSKIDYILVDDKWDTRDCSYQVIDAVSNTSTHLALELVIQYPIKISLECMESLPPPKLRWHKADLQKYRDTLGSLLCDANEIVSTDIAVQHLLESLRLATDIAVPAVCPKKKKAVWNDSIQRLLATGRATNRKWNAAGRPAQPDELAISRKTIQRQLRRAQRMESARKRELLYHEIMSASSDDKRLFFHLVKKQRSSFSQCTKELIMGDFTYTEDLTQIWMLHFSKLATPSQNSLFDQQYADRVSLDTKAIEIQAVEQLVPLSLPITQAEVHHTISKLKLHKAKDEFQLVAEHIRYAKDEIVPFLTAIINMVINSGRMPDVIKGGVLHPILKKDKAKNVPTHYRGITITAIIGKIIDCLHLQHQETAVNTKHHLQFGFIKGRSCSGAALLVSEAIYESKDNKQPLYLAVLDVAKAFDVVFHPSLLRKLYVHGLRDNWWLLKQSMMSGMYSRVLWQGELSAKFPIYQGNRQGGNSSPSDYCTYKYEELQILDDAKCGTYIGDIHIPAPTCADDTILMSDHISDLQAQLELAGDYSRQERYEVQLAKTSIVPMNVCNDLTGMLGTSQPWELNGDKVNVTSTFTHLGIQRDNLQAGNGTDPVISARLSLARKTTYALMGVGCFGYNGLPPNVNIQIYKIYVIPRLIYGLEAVKLRRKDYLALELQHRSFIRNILCLPTRTAIPALHIISSLLPIQASIEEKTLSFFRSCLVVPGVLQDIIIRQHATKNGKSHSWIVYVEKMLAKYELPTIMEILLHAPSKQEWKKMVKAHIHDFWQDHLENTAATMSTLIHMNVTPSFLKAHHAIGVINSISMVKRANVKLRLLTGTYTLQSVRARVYRQIASPLCLLCREEEENVEHFILLCPTLERERVPHLKAIMAQIPYVFRDIDQFYKDNHLLLHLILDPTHPCVSERLPLQDEIIMGLEIETQILLHTLHCKRLRLHKAIEC